MGDCFYVASQSSLKDECWLWFLMKSKKKTWKQKHLSFSPLYRSIVPRVLGQIKRLITTWRRGFCSTPWNCSTSGMKQCFLQSPIRKRKKELIRNLTLRSQLSTSLNCFRKYWFLDPWRSCLKLIDGSTCTWFYCHCLIRKKNFGHLSQVKWIEMVVRYVEKYIDIARWANY